MTDHSLSQEKIEQFDRDGFLHLPGQIPMPLLSDLQAATQAAINEVTGFELANEDHAHKRYCHFSYNFARPHITAFYNILHYLGPEMLSLLGCPQVMAIASSLSGPSAVNLLDVMMAKIKYSYTHLIWHQDVDRPTVGDYRRIGIGVYLDDSDPHDGGVLFIPGSHTQPQNCDVFNTEPPEYYAAPVIKAGDILIHDPMTVHASTIMKKGDLRRTIYLEFRPVEQVLEEENHLDLARREETLRQRLNLQRLAADSFEKHYGQGLAGHDAASHAQDWHGAEICSPYLDGEMTMAQAYAGDNPFIPDFYAPDKKGGK